MSVWRQEPFVAVISDESGGNLKTPQSEYQAAGRYPIVDQGKDLIAGYTDDEARLCRATLPVIVFGDHTRCFKYVDFPFCMGADGVKVLRPKINADLKYLYHYLRQLRLTEGGYDRHFKYLKRSTIALPPLPEQRRIAEILDEADALRAKRRAALAQLDTLSQSIFLDMFGEPATNPKGWPVEPLAALGEITTGKTPPTQKDGMFGGDIPFATPSDLDTRLEFTQRTLTDEGASYVKLVRAGSALVGCIGNIGKLAKTPVRTAFNQQINAIEWSDSIADDYGISVLRFATPQMLALASSTTVPILNKSGFSKVRIPVPPRAMQNEFASRLQGERRLLAKFDESRKELDALFASLQSCAFRGEL